jgi:NADPH-dependent 2,4-dienoyl-CoA reductase/sulfur reductase-like enzyme
VSERPRRVLVVGAGPAGIAAACAAAESGAAVVVLDDNPAAGGQIWRGGEDRDAARWIARLNACGAEIRYGARAIAPVGTAQILVERDGAAMTIAADELILATGARELFLPFPGWTLPGVTGIGGLQALVRAGLPIEGRRVVLCGSGPLLLAVGAHLREHGAVIEAIAEQAEVARLARFASSLVRWPGKLAHAARLQRAVRSISFMTGAWPLAADGDGRVASVLLRTTQGTHRLACDYLACAFGLVPNVELPAVFGCRVENGAVAVDEWQRTTVEHVWCAGEPTGIGGLERSLAEGQIAGYAAAGTQAKARELFGTRATLHRFSAELAACFALREELKTLATPDTIVCRCEDVRLGQLAAHDCWRSAKLQTRCGMGACQGRICGPAVQVLFGWPKCDARPPAFPASMATLAGRGDG